MNRDDLTEQFLQQFVGGQYHAISRNSYSSEWGEIIEISLRPARVHLELGWSIRKETTPDTWKLRALREQEGINLDSHPHIGWRGETLWFGSGWAGAGVFLIPPHALSMSNRSALTLVGLRNMRCLIDSELARWPDGHFSDLRRLHAASCEKCRLKTVEAHRVALLTRPVPVRTSA